MDILSGAEEIQHNLTQIRFGWTSQVTRAGPEIRNGLSYLKKRIIISSMKRLKIEGFVSMYLLQTRISWLTCYGMITTLQ